MATGFSLQKLPNNYPKGGEGTVVTGGYLSTPWALLQGQGWGSPPQDRTAE